MRIPDGRGAPTRDWLEEFGVAQDRLDHLVGGGTIETYGTPNS